VEAALKHAWRHAPSAWQAGIDLLNDAHTEHDILCDIVLEDDDA
jgi:hypothetical protein